VNTPHGRRDRHRGAIDRPVFDRESARSFLRSLVDDVGYLEFKESIGEVLAPSERARLEAARAAAAEQPEGGGR
jgi:hypothetical protein